MLADAAASAATGSRVPSLRDGGGCEMYPHLGSVMSLKNVDLYQIMMEKM